jgi:hypothetical protein
MDDAGGIGRNVENNGTFNNNGTGTVLGNLDNNATAANAGVILGNADNSGDLGNSNLIVGNLLNSGGFTNTGAVNGTTANSGTLVNTGTGFLLGDVTNSSGLTTDAGGIGDTATLTNNAGGIVTLNGDDTIATHTSNAGILQGPGTLTAATYNLNNNSVVDGNLGAGTLDANGTVTYPGTSMADTVNIRSGITSLTGAGQFGMDSSLFDISSGARLDLGGADYRFATIQGTGTAGGLSGAVMNLLLPEVHQGMDDFTEQSMRGLVRLATRAAPLAKAGKTNVFAAVHSTSAGSTDSTTNAAHDISLAGLVTGARYEVAPNIRIGPLLACDDGNIDGALIHTDGKGYVLGAFGEYVIDEPSQTTVFASLSYGDYEYDAARRSFGGLATANGIGADALESAVGIRGVGYEVDNFRLIPNATLRYLSGEVDGFVESGPGVPLWVSGYDFDSLLLEVGVDAELKVNDAVTVAGHIGFQTGFSDSGNSIGASFANGMAPFTVFAPGVDDEAFVIAAGAYFDVTEEVRLNINWRSELRDSSQSVHSIGIGASFGF